MVGPVFHSDLSCYAATSSHLPLQVPTSPLQTHLKIARLTSLHRKSILSPSTSNILQLTPNIREKKIKKTCLHLPLLHLHLHPSKYGLIPPKAAASTQPNPSLPAKSSSLSPLFFSYPLSRISTSSAHTVSAREILVPVPAATRPRTATRRAKQRPGKQFIRGSARYYGRGSRMKIGGGGCRRRQGR